MTAGIGMACGGGLAGLAAALYFIALVLTVFGCLPAALLAANLKDMDGILSVSSDDPNAADD